MLAVDFLPGGTVQSSLQQVAAGVAAGQFAPLPVTCHNLASAAAALRQLSQASAVGKVVVSATQPMYADLQASAASNTTAGHVLITGGTGALGLLVATWLAGQQGMRQLTLVSRSGRTARASTADARQRQLAALLAGGLQVQVVAADMAMSEDEYGLAAVLASGAPLLGMFHASGALQDATLRRQTLKGLHRVWGPKASAWSTWQRVNKQQPVLFSLLFSSVASLMGSAGQANYAAANAALDEHAAIGLRQGLPAFSIRWGAWAGAGMAATDVVKAKVAALGMGLVQPAAGLAALERLLTTPTLATAVQLQHGHVSVVEVVPLKQNRLLQRYKQLPILFSDLAERAQVSAGRTVSETAVKTPEVPMQPSTAAATAAEQWDVAAAVNTAVHTVLGREVAGDEPLMAAGLDSLGAVELRNTLENTLNMQLPPTLMFDYPSPAAITAYVSSRVAATGTATRPRPAVHQAATARPSPTVDDSMWFDFAAPVQSINETMVPAAAAVPAAVVVRPQYSVVQEVSAAVASILGRAVDQSAALMASGLDSLGSVELQNVLQSRFNLPLPATIAMDYPSVASIAQYIHTRLTAVAAGTTPAMMVAAAALPHMPLPIGSLAVAGGAARMSVGLHGIATRIPGIYDGYTALAGLDAIQAVPLDR
eukprot:GHRR01014944.1.p1 GENE.GHRR01014944.1~~GHRR01014944.1.p1  ORF type:complete len:677 (+),score=280.93 GHRR01014944.1:73-2031(+)